MHKKKLFCLAACLVLLAGCGAVPVAAGSASAADSLSAATPAPATTQPPAATPAPATTQPPAATSAPATAQSVLAGMTTRQKVGQLFCVSFGTTTLEAEPRTFLADYAIGSVILFGKNVGTAAETAALCAAVQQSVWENTGTAALIGVDQEGGRVVRITDGAVAYPAAADMAAAGNPENARLAGLYTGQELAALGFNLDFAPVADVNSNPANPIIGSRAFGTDPATAAVFACAFADGLEEAGVVAVAKHFPGHGDTDTDSHLGLPVIDKTVEQLQQVELLPFQALIDRDIPAVMAAHILFPQLDAAAPASLSRTIQQELLRGQLGFTGLIITDSLRMGAITQTVGTPAACVQAVQAGAGLLCLGSGELHDDDTLTPQADAVQAVLDAVESGEITEETLDSAVLQVLTVKEKYGLLAPQPATTPLDADTLAAHRAFAEEMQ